MNVTDTDFYVNTRCQLQRQTQVITMHQEKVLLINGMGEMQEQFKCLLLLLTPS